MARCHMAWKPEPVYGFLYRLASKVHFVAPSRERLDAVLTQCLSWFNNPPADIDGLIGAGIGYLW